MHDKHLTTLQASTLMANTSAYTTPLPCSDAQPVCSTVLLNGQPSVAIDHEGTRYVLRATRTGKLILTK